MDPFTIPVPAIAPGAEGFRPVPRHDAESTGPALPPGPTVAAPPANAPGVVGALLMGIIGYPLSSLVAALPVMVVAAGVAAGQGSARGLRERMWPALATPAMQILMLASAGVAATALVLAAVALRGRPVRSSLGLVRPAGGVPALTAAIAGALAIALCAGALASLGVRMRWWPDIPHSSLVNLLSAAMRSASPGMAILLALAMGVFPAVSEELLFRGYVLRGLLHRWPAAAAIGVGAVLFAMWHVYPARLVSTLPFALFACYVTWRMRSILPAMLAHFLVNSGVGLAVAWARTPPHAHLPIRTMVVLFALSAIGFAGSLAAFRHAMRDQPGGEPRRRVAPPTTG